MKNRVGLGTFPLAGVFSKVSRNKVEEVVSFFIEKGGYYIDTAPLYGFGDIEELLGSVLKRFPREKYYLATKCGYIDVEGKTSQTVLKSGRYKDVLRECDRSLQRLNVDFIDLYFVHSPDTNTPFDETMEALTKLREQGKIKEIGVSNVNLAELKEYNKSGKVRFIQNRFSLLNRSIDQAFQKYIMNHRIKLVPYQAIDRGQLTGKVFEGVGNLKDGDLRIGRPDWQAEKVQVIAGWVKESLSPIAKKLGITIGQLSISWALHQRYTGFVIIGVTNPKFIPINLKADSIVLSVDVIKEINDAYKGLEKQVKEKYGMSIREFRGLNEKYY